MPMRLGQKIVGTHTLVCPATIVCPTPKLCYYIEELPDLY